jgi:hypothetical protein
MKSRLAYSAAGIAGAVLLALAACDWLFYQSFALSLLWR